MILKSREKQNPYTYGSHIEGCPESIWDSPSELIGIVELRKLKCEGCDYEHKLWSDILKFTSDEAAEPATLYGDLALRGLALVSKVIDLRYPVTELEPFDFNLLQICHAEINKREAFHAWEANKEASK